MIEKIFGEAKGIFNTLTLIEIGISIIYILIGLIFFTNASLSNTLVSIVTGVILLLNGIEAIFSYFKRDGIDLFNNNLIYGIMLILVSILACIFQNILTIFVGVYFLIIGAQKINYSLLLKKYHESCWPLVLVMGIFFVVISIITFFINGDGVINGIGIGLMGYGLIELIDTILLRKRSQYFLA